LQRINFTKIGDILVQDLNIPQRYVNEVLKKSVQDKILFGEGASKLKLIDKEKIVCALSKQYGINYIAHNEIMKNLYFDVYKQPEVYKDIFGFETQDYFMEFCLENKIYILNHSKENNFFDDMFKSDSIFIKGNGQGSIVVLIGDYDNFQTEQKIKKLEKTFEKIYIIATTNTLFSFIETKYLSPTLEEIETHFKNSGEEETKTEISLKMLLTYIISNGISDLHIEPNYDNKYRVSGRKDGERVSFFYLDMKYGSKLIGVIKNKSKMVLETKRKPQDGQLSGSEDLKDYTLPIKRGVEKLEPKFNFSDTSFRISTYPNADNNSDVSISSESVVLRVLNSDESLAVLENLNLTKQTETEILYSIQQRSGIIIVSGPTGSGKTTTLYALLSKLDYLSEKIITFEDPVEIRNKFWTQGEKTDSNNDTTKFSFVDAKKAILRQDPDIILMGEIRDNESAKFALEAANTGHLVLATLHANSSMLVINRLMELGVDRSEVINSVRCSFSQRLVKRICPHCKTKKDITDVKFKDFFDRNEIEEKLRPKQIFEINHNGCHFCDFTGFKGRVLVDEVLPFNNQIKEKFIDLNNLIYLRKTITEEFKFNTMLLNGITKVSEGIIPFSELNKLL